VFRTNSMILLRRNGEVGIYNGTVVIAISNACMTPFAIMHNVTICSFVY